jgi:hypothetical protein
LKLGLGNPNDPSAVIWEDVRRDHSSYRIEMNISCDGRVGKRRAFLWKRTHSLGVEKSKPWVIGPANFKLVEEQTGELIAVFARSGFKSVKKMGKIEILKTYGKGFDTMILLTGLYLCMLAEQKFCRLV